MSAHLWMIPALPLIGFLVNGCLKLPKTTAAVVGCLGPLVALVLSFVTLRDLPASQRVFEWMTVGDWSVAFGLSVDHLGAIMLLVVTGVGSLIHIYSIGYMHDDPAFSRYFAYLNLFMFSMLVLVMADSIVLMFLGWEGVGLCSYLLIGFWFKDLRNADAGKKAFVTNRVGDFAFLLGIFVLWQMFGTLDFAGMKEAGIEPETTTSDLAKWAALLLFLGACGKSAQIPLHVWLPDAMAGPTPVSALIHAATMVTAGVYMLARMSFLFIAAPVVMEFVATIAALTALMAALVAMTQNDIKKVLAYSTVSQLGFMFAGAAATAFSAGIFHVVTHAFFKALLFMGAGAVIHSLGGEQDIRKMGGLAGQLKVIFAVFLAGSAALAGFPLTAGFFSKDLILASSLQMSGFLFVTLALAAAITAFYTTRLVLIVFVRKSDHHHHIHKPGLTMTLPLVILALLSLFGGAIFEHSVLDGFTTGMNLEGMKETKSMAVIFSIAAFVVGVGSALVLYLWKPGIVKRFVEGPGKVFHTLASNKFYFDEIYDILVVKPLKAAAVVAWYLVDRLLIDTMLVHGTGRIAVILGGLLRRPHTGSLAVGLFTLAAGAAAVLAWVVYRFIV
jgi:NADH-quinone oxidoreductase subunit L